MDFNPCQTQFSPPPQMPVVVQPVGVDPSILIQMQGTIHRLEARLQQAKLREAAYDRLYQTEGSGYWMRTPSGYPVQLTSFHFTAARARYYDPLHRRPPEIELMLSCTAAPLLIAETDFFDDHRLLAALQRHARCTIPAKPSARKAAELLRGAAAAQMESVWLPFFSGWTRDLTTGAWGFQTFSSFRTCSAGIPELPVSPPEVLPAAAVVATSALTSAYEAVTAPWLRGTPLLWQHAAFLASVLREADMLPRKALLLTPPSPAAEQLLADLLSFPGDTAGSLDSDVQDFAKTLACAKDRPLLFRDGDSAAALENARRLHAALCCGTVSLFSGKAACTVPLRALPLILGSDRSPLFALSSVICLCPDLQDFDPEVRPKAAFSPEYGYALADFVLQHVSELNACLRRGREQALCTADAHGLDSGHADLLATLEGLRQFLTGFFTHFGLSLEPTVPENWLEGLAAAMEVSNQRACPEGLDELFLDGLRALLRAGRFTCCPRGQCAPVSSSWGSVYYDADGYYLDRAAFATVCREAQLQPGLVKQTLRKAGLFRGRPCSARSYETRISACNVYGIRSVLLVYALDRDAVDLPGEPPVLAL